MRDVNICGNGISGRRGFRKIQKGFSATPLAKVNGGKIKGGFHWLNLPEEKTVLAAVPKELSVGKIRQSDFQTPLGVKLFEHAGVAGNKCDKRNVMLTAHFVLGAYIKLAVAMLNMKGFVLWSKLRLKLGKTLSATAYAGIIGGKKQIMAAWTHIKSDFLQVSAACAVFFKASA